MNLLINLKISHIVIDPERNIVFCYTYIQYDIIAETMLYFVLRVRII